MEFLVAIGTGIVGKIAEYTVAPAASQVGYLIHYNRNLKKLQSQLSDLDAIRESVERKINQEERSGRKVEAFVNNWLKDVNKITGEAKDILKDEHHVKCLHGFCPNLKLRHQLSRKSTKLVQDVAELHEKKDFSSFAYEVNEVFASRISIVKEIMDELRNSKICMIGVYGIGGVGKTTLVKQVYRQVTEHEKLFDDVVLVLDVKNNPSIGRLQKEIAEKLGMDHRENETEAGRARHLCDRIKGKNMLLILDDVWERIDLEAVGLPPLSTLKILLTSRSQRVLSSEMGTQKEFPLDVLDEKETWTLFEKMSGEIVKNAAIQSIATKVAKRCGGLPVLFVTVARALKNGTIHEWKDALKRLKKLDGQGLTEKAYSAIEWSYSKLDNEELKSLFMFFGVVVGVANTFDTVDLWKYSMGLGLLKDVDTVGEAWDALCSMIEQLKDSCLLLESDDNTRIRMHDLVKDVANRIASREQHVLSISPGSELTEWPDKDFCSKCTMICLKQCDIPEFPEVLQCQELTLFLLDNEVREIPCNLFREMKKLRVLDLTRFSIPSLPSSLQFLESLRTLCLDQCTLGDVTLIGQLQNLEILSFVKSKFKELPKEIGLLTRLRLLDLTDCSQLQVISPNVLSSLKRLEHLRMRNSFNRWEGGGVISRGRGNANLEELKNLLHLTELQLHIPNANILPPDLFTGCKLERFQICIGSVWKWDDVDEAINALKLQLTASNQIDQGLATLLKRTEDLYLEGMEGVYSSIVYQLGAKGSHKLKHLHVQNNVEFTNFLSIIYGKVWYPNLTWLAVNDLNGLRFLLSSSMARSLAQLKRLQVSGCQITEEIVSLDESDEEIVDNLFCHLQDLELKDLPNLTKFCSRNYTELSNPSIGKLQLVDCNKTNPTCEEIEETDSTRNLDIVIQHFLFDNKVEFPNLKKLSIDGLAKLTTIWNNQLSLSSENLETIEIVSSHSLKSIFPASVARSLQQLRSLKVRNCGVEEIVSKEDGVQTTPMFVFSKLTYVRFQDLPQLKSFYPESHSSKWPSLVTLLVYNCTEVQTFAEGSCELNNLCTPNKKSLFLLEKDSFPNLEDLGLNIMENWDSPPLHLFRKLKCLNSYAYANSSANSLEKLLGLEKANVSSNGEIHAVGDGTLPHLRELYLYGMRKLMNLGEDSFGPASPYFRNLEILELEDCDSLKNLRSSAISFKNLTSLQVSCCKGLKYLISFSMAKILMQLTKLEVQDCEEMIEILGSNEDDDSENEIEFRVLKHLELSALPSLRGFCSGTQTVKFPSMETLSMSSCPQLEAFIIDRADKSNTIGKDIKDTNSNENIETGVVQQFLFDNKVEFPRLKSLSIEGLTKLTAIWHSQLSLESSKNLEIIDIVSCDSLKSIFPVSMARNVKQLKRLIVKSCGVQEIVAREEGLQTTPKFVFPKVTQVIFRNLSNLMNFYLGMHVSSWPSLNELRVVQCAKVNMFLEEISSFQEHSELERLSVLIPQSFFIIEEDSFPNLERLTMNAMEFSNGPLPVAAQLFSKLKYLDVCCPESTSAIFLDKLLNREGNNTSSAVGIGTSQQQLPHLKQLRLTGMEKLMQLGQDDEEDNSQSTPRIPNIPNLEILLVNACHSLRNLRSPAISFNNLTTLRVSYCHGLNYLITYSMAKSLMQLTTMEVEGCGRLVVIVGSNEDSNSRNKITFRRLKHLKLSRLPGLQGFCSGNCIAKFPSLETSSMSNRLKLKIFPTHNQMLQLTNEEEDTDVDHWEEEMNSAICAEIHGVGDGILPHLRGLNLYEMRKLMNLGEDSFGPACPYFPNLEILKTDDCDSLKNLRSTAIFFKNLTTLQVSRCKGLKYLTSFSIIKSLMQLTNLEVQECEEMIEIVGSNENEDSENDIEFRVLKHLELSDLPSLRGFCSATRIVKFPSLENLSMRSCTQLEAFIFDPTDKSNTIGKDIKDTNSNENIGTGVVQQFLFDNKVEFPRLKSLSMEGLTKLTAIWHSQLSLHSFIRLKDLQVHGCGNLINIFLPSTMGRLNALETLLIKECKSVQVVFELRGIGVRGIHDTLAVNQLRSFDFENLDSVEIDSCESLKNIFPVSVARNLHQLKRLIVKSCGVQEIVAKEESLQTIPTFVFPKIRNVIFCDLSRLTNFYPGMHVSNWPSLNELRVVQCAKVKTFVAEISSFEGHNEPERLSVLIPQSLFLIEKNGLPNLTSLMVHRCDGLNFLLVSSMARSLVKLKHLVISECQRMEEVLTKEHSEENKDEMFPDLKELELNDLPHLVRFCSGNYFEFASMERLQLEKCAKLETFICNPSSNSIASQKEMERVDKNENLETVVPYFLFDKKVGLPRLERLIINELPKLTTIWHTQLAPNSFHRLGDITVQQCNGLKYIFQVSIVAGVFQQLQKLIVKECVVEEIVSQEESVEKLMPDQFFPKLTCLEFTSLFQLERFYLNMPAINWPLKTLVLSDFQKVDIFAAEFSGLRKEHDLGNLRTRVKQYPVLFEKSSFSKLEVLTFGPVNIWNGRPAHEKALFPATSTDGSLPHLRTLRLHGMEKFMRLWENTEPAAGSAFPKMETLEVKNSGLTNLELSAISFRNLTILEVTFCWRLQYLTTYSVARSLVHLKTLKVDECKNMKEIFTSEGMREDASECEIEFSQLQSLELSDLVSLERFCSSNCRVKVPILGTLKVNWCPFKLKISSDTVLEVDGVQTESSSQSMSMLEQDNRRLREELRAKEGNSLPETPVVLALPESGPSSSLTAKRTADLPVEVIAQLNALLGIDLATPAVDKKSSSNHIVTELTAQLEERSSELIAGSSQVEAECQEVVGREAELANIRQLIKLLEARAATLEAR